MHFESNRKLYAGSADVPSATRADRREVFVNEIRSFSRFALNADETSAFPAK